jgi:phosphate transport system ATP-binding protein
MQQAARVSDDTVFMYIGEMIEHNPTKKIFENPEKELTDATYLVNLARYPRITK